MKTINFKETISAPAQKIWEILWNDETYRKWTSAFSEGSYAVSDWKEGSQVLFLSPSGEGMYSEVAKSDPPKFMSFRHIGVCKEGKPQPQDDETKKWAGATENYSLFESDNETTLSVDVDVTGDFENYLTEAFPKALRIVKELSEATATS